MTTNNHRNRTRGRITSGLLAAAIGLATAGCAVLTIDVDIYKGPLANHENVQARQIEGMVIGAKSLLVDMRYDLEARANADPAHLAQLDTADNLPSEWPFCSREARTVNEVLGLYKDRLEPELTSLRRRGRDALEAYLTAYAVLSDANVREEEAWWNGLLATVEASPAANQQLAAAYREFFVPRRGQRDTDAIGRYIGRTRAARARELSEVPNAVCEALLDEGLVGQHARDLGLEGTARAEFIRRTQELARAYLQAREGLDDLLVVVLDGLIWAGDERDRIGESDPARQRALQAAIDAAVTVVLELSQPRYLVGILREGTAEAPAIVGSTDIAIALAGIGENGWSPVTYAQAKDRLRQRFLTAPAHVARSLLALHRYAKTTVTPLGKSLDHQSGWWFGIARAPFGEDIDTDTIVAKMGTFAQVVAGAFANGRPDFGLEKLIDDYIRAVEGNGAAGRNPEGVAEAQFQLTNALIPFAEKMLFVATYGVLLDQKGDRGGRISARLLQAVGNSILIQVDELTHRQAHAQADERWRDRERAAIDATFTRDASAVLARLHASLIDERFATERALAAARARVTDLTASLPEVPANAAADDPAALKRAETQSEIDELAEEIARLETLSADLATTRNVVASQTAWAVARGTGAVDSGELIAALLAQLATLNTDDARTASRMIAARRFAVLSTPELPEELANGRATIDQLIAALDYRRMEAIAALGPDSPQAQRLQATLDAAYQRRSSMIYIRPPAAYLRSSYPVTSLQDDPGLQWNNMLGDHALRSVPFAPQLRDMFNRQGQRDARTQAEIDRTFWQNINRVRVAGGGDVNYAIAKDDIGNWYVKSYSADPKVIIESARNLALFNAGASMGADLIGRLPKEGEGNRGNRSGEPVPGWREQQYQQFRADYERNAQQTYQAVRTAISGLDVAGTLTTGDTATLGAVWRGVADASGTAVRADVETDLKTVLSVALQATKSSAAATAPKEGEHGAAIVQGLRSLVNFDRTARTSIDALVARYTRDVEDALRDSQAAELKAREAQDAVVAKTAEVTALRDRYDDLAAVLRGMADDAPDRDRLVRQVSAAESAVETADERRQQLEGQRDDANRLARDKTQAYDTVRQNRSAKIAAARAAASSLDTLATNVVRRLVARRRAEVATYKSVIEVLGRRADLTKETASPAPIAPAPAG